MYGIIWIAMWLSCGICSAENRTETPTIAELSARTFFIFYYACENNTTAICSKNYTINQCSEITENAKYVQTLSTTCYVHGFNENEHSVRVKLMVDSYVIYYRKSNLFSVDWSYLASKDYDVASSTAPAFGELIGHHIFNAITSRAFNISKFHLIGTSLGAQIASAIGKTIYKLSENTFKLARITGLDPARPNFEDNKTSTERRLSATDAEFVDVLHGDAGIYGTNYSIACADFWPNGGRRYQPGCLESNAPYGYLTDAEVCSHGRVVELFSESLRNFDQSKNFYATTKNSNGKMSTNKADVVQMGINCPTSARGDYYLKTGSVSPYTLGLDGIKES